jgi:Ni/Co efflux regulator RcnB
MKHVFAALTAIGLVFANAAAQDEPGHERPQQHGHPHDQKPAPGPNPAPRIGAPNRHEGAGVQPNLGRIQGHTDADRPGAGPHGFDARNGFKGNFHAEQRFHATPWHPPRGYQYRHWSYGERLPALYFAPSLWISSFALYGLMAPPPDTVWVRSGPDALLVDRATGGILRVQYDVFY